MIGLVDLVGQRRVVKGGMTLICRVIRSLFVMLIVTVVVVPYTIGCVRVIDEGKVPFVQKRVA
jgi:hypothetical protein